MREGGGGWAWDTAEKPWKGAEFSQITSPAANVGRDYRPDGTEAAGFSSALSFPSNPFFRSGREDEASGPLLPFASPQ
ncbi:hypothetical protein JCM17961_43430 [Endothiovibrio diazotrophicus]